MYNLGIRYTDRFEDMKKNGIGLLIHGEPGNGKTYLSCCIANRLIKKYIPTMCVSINGLLDRIKETYSKWGDDAGSDIIRRVNRADLLIIDDLGTEQQTDWSRSIIYDIIDSRYRSGLPMIITSNLKISKGDTKVLVDLYGKRLEDRILERCTPVENRRPSIRAREAVRNTEILNSLLKDTEG
jgi:DNA replication protein DnaC